MCCTYFQVLASYNEKLIPSQTTAIYSNEVVPISLKYNLLQPITLYIMKGDATKFRPGEIITCSSLFIEHSLWYFVIHIRNSLFICGMSLFVFGIRNSLFIRVIRYSYALFEVFFSNNTFLCSNELRIECCYMLRS